ncbi:hypothetical protein F5I97DRAFT_1893195 [Phlebopus sp. FC_14]|nr:hypothetical protein F5I97DRAFT_1893195 [Phlebopus sp. FC_14]
MTGLSMGDGDVVTPPHRTLLHAQIRAHARLVQGSSRSSSYKAAMQSLIRVRLPPSLERALPRYVTRFMRYGPWVVMVLAALSFMGAAAKITTAYVASNFSSAVNVDLIEDDDGSLQGVVLLANVWDLDTNAGTMSVHWSVMGGCGEQYTFQKNATCVQNGFSLPMNLYVNVVPSSAWTTTPPTGQYDPNDILDPPAAYYIPERQSIPTMEFDTVLPMDPFLPYTENKTSTVLYYPFDTFRSYASLVAINPTDNSTIPIAYARGYGTVVNWVGMAIFTWVQPPGMDMQYSLTLTQERQLTVKAFVIVILLTNWILSLSVLWMTIIIMFRQRIPSSLLLASTTILFALPQIRASMPDAPQFGAYVGESGAGIYVSIQFVSFTLHPDIGGYFMNVCLVSVCVRTHHIVHGIVIPHSFVAYRRLSFFSPSFAIDINRKLTLSRQTHREMASGIRVMHRARNTRCFPGL